MEAIRRLIPVAQIAGWVVAGLLAVNLALWGVDAAWPNWLPYRMEGEGFRDDITQRVRAAQERYTQDAGNDQYLCVLLGLSSLREATDLKLLGQLSNAKCRYLGLCGAGPALDAIPEEAHELTQSSLRPDLVVLGINEFLQAKPVAPTAGAAAGPEHSKLTEAIRHGNVRNVAKELRSLIWFYERRRDISEEIESLLLAGKDKILHAMGAQMENPMTDPWREMIRLGGPEHASAVALGEQIAAYKARDLFDAQTYEKPAAREQIDTLCDLVRTLEDRGAKVVVLVMPERSELRNQIPPVALKQLETELQLKLGKNAPPVLNLRQDIVDDDFTDISHVNSQGREAFTRLLAGKIGEYLPKNHQPPMAQKDAAAPAINP